MKLGTLRNGTRDGRLVVVSADVTFCSDAHHIAPTLQNALDNWERVAPHLELIARGLESGGQPMERFHEREAHAPLPRAFQWLEAGPGAADFQQRVSDGFLDPRSAIRCSGGSKLRAGLAAIVGDLNPGADEAEAAAAIRLVMLVTICEGSGPGSATFSPVAVAPEALGRFWDRGRMSGTLLLEVNGRTGRRAIPTALDCDLAALVARAARARALSAGHLVSSGALVEVETAPGDTARIEMREAGGHSVFGAIEQSLPGIEVAA